MTVKGGRKVLNDNKVNSGKFRGKTRRTLLISLVLALGISFATYAYLSWDKLSVKNTFSPDSEVNPVINETFTGSEKTGVYVNVNNTENYSVFVRAAVVVTWSNGAETAVLSEVPVENEDYKIEYNFEADSSGKCWFRGTDGFFYCNTPIEANKNTPILIKSCVPIKAAPVDGYTLDVKIVAQTIQSAGTTDDTDIPAVTDAWGITVKDGKLVKPAS